MTNNQQSKERSVNVIKIKNNSDDKLYNVKVFDAEFEKQHKITYSSPDAGVNYSDILEKLQTSAKENKIINLLYYQASCGYEKFQRKQLHCPFKCFTRDENGNGLVYNCQFIIDPYQNQTDSVSFRITDFKLPIDKYLQIELAYLMPETEINFYFYSDIEKVNE